MRVNRIIMSLWWMYIFMLSVGTFATNVFFQGLIVK